jgi:DNA-binding IclR family transcriptional regulator
MKVMPRPALSASRSLDVVDFLSSFPDRRFTLSQIAKATRINPASCHAILGVLAERGYVNRASDQKSYSLGAAFIAVGEATLRAHPTIVRARRAAEELLADLGLPVMLCALVGNEILSVFSIEDAAGGFAAMHAGDRMPLVAPAGMPFLAWASEETVEAWIRSHENPVGDEVVAGWRRGLELTRLRGYQVQMRTSPSDVGTSMAAFALGRGTSDYKDEVQRLINALDHQMAQPEIIEPDELYDVMLIASPLFDESGTASMNLCLGGFSAKLSGAMLATYAERLVHACVQVMRGGRARGAIRALAN